MPLINCEINLQLKSPTSCFLVADTAANQVLALIITDTKLYVPVVTVSAQHNINLLKLLEFSYTITINLNKYQSKITNQANSIIIF